MLGIGQLECVSYDVVCDVFYCVNNEKALISVNDRQDRKLHVRLCKLVVKTCPRHFWNFFLS